MISAADLDELMRQGWRAQAEVNVGGWVARLSEGVTQRANSVLPATSPLCLGHAVAQVEQLYRAHGLAPTFQISPAARPAGLDEALARRGYELQSPTIVQVAVIEDVLRKIPRPGLDAEVLNQPETYWMDLWWSIDGRGNSQARAVAHDILTGGPALYASTRDKAGVAAVGRLALVGAWAGLYCMATRRGARRRGHATGVLRALLEHAADYGVRRAWLQVVADNKAACKLYERAGFIRSSTYHYRTLPAS